VSKPKSVVDVCFPKPRKPEEVENGKAFWWPIVGKAFVYDDRIELRGFGAFSVKSRNARMGRNPRTGTSVEVVAKRVPFFKTGKELRERLNAPKE